MYNCEFFNIGQGNVFKSQDNKLKAFTHDNNLQLTCKSHLYCEFITFVSNM